MESKSEESVDMSPMELLPTEILQKILSYLPVTDRVRVERVCKRWKNVSTERIWKDVQVLHIIKSKRTDPSELSLHKLNLDRIMKSLKNSDRPIRMEGNKLYIPADQLGTIQSLVSRAGQHIKRLLFFFSNSNHTSAKPMLSIITAHCHNIEVIQLKCLESSAIDVFSELLKVNEQLHSISCQRADNIIKLLPLRDWKLLHLGAFTFFHEKVYVYGGYEEDLSENLVALIENSPSLESFRSSQWSTNMSAAIAKCEQLKTLHLPDFTTAVHNLVMKTSFLNRLTCLKLEGTDDDFIINLLSHCVNLECLGLFYSSQLFANMELPLGVIRAVLALPKLESLELDATSLTNEILSHFLKFKRLRMGNRSDFITNNGIFELIMNSECLERLEIPKINVTIELFNRLARHAGDRCKILEIEVPSRIYSDALWKCHGIPIHIIREETPQD